MVSVTLKNHHRPLNLKGNANVDLMVTLCASAACTTTMQATACYTHWTSTGIIDGRTFTPEQCTLLVFSTEFCTQGSIGSHACSLQALPCMCSMPFLSSFRALTGECCTCRPNSEGLAVGGVDETTNATVCRFNPKSLDYTEYTSGVSILNILPESLY
jgi:hypothetical protein